MPRNPYLSALIGIIRYKKLDWKAIHQYGMHLADTRPPMHVSSEEMVIFLLEALAKILKSIKKEPKLITISRSVIPSVRSEGGCSSLSSCVDDGFCSLEQADLIQKYVERKLRKLYHIDQTMGKSVLNNADDEDEEEVRDMEKKEQNPTSMSDDEYSHLSSNGNVANPPVISDTETPLNVETTKPPASTSDNPTTVLSPSANENNRTASPPPASSPAKGDRSPVQVTKAISPSSLSEASPTQD